MKKYMWTTEGMEANESSGNYCRASDVDARIEQLERQLAFANDAAAKGEAARLTAAGMEARIDELEGALKSCAMVISHSIAASNTVAKLAGEALAEADKALTLGLMESRP